MNLYDRKYAEFKVSDLFTVKYGVNLELNACVECDKLDDDKVNFVARIKLPVNADGNPDWQFMEDYIKALPYGDRLEG